MGGRLILGWLQNIAPFKILSNASFPDNLQREPIENCTHLVSALDLVWSQKSIFWNTVGVRPPPPPEIGPVNLCRVNLLLKSIGKYKFKQI